MRHSSRPGIFSTLVFAVGLLTAPLPGHAAPAFSVTQSFQKATPLADDFVANAVAAVGANVLVGAAADDTWAPDAGAAYLFNPTSGAVIRSFKATAPAAYDAFGYSVAAFGTDVLVGAIYDDTAATDAGAVYLFDGTNGNVKQVFVSPAPSSSEQFGFAVTALGNLVIVGAPGTGAVYAFDSTNGGLVWGQTGTGQDGFGSALAILGSNVVVGAPFDDTGASVAGSAYVLDGGNGAFVLTLRNPTPDANEAFGFAVAAVDNGDILVGAPFENTKAPSAGAAYLFDGDTGDLLKTLYNPSPAAQEWFGSAVAAWGTGGVLIAAAYDSTVAPNAGAVYLYETTDSHYTLLYTFNKSTPVAQDQLGAAIATVDLDVVVGVTGDDTGAENAGLALYFQKVASCGDGHVDPGEACDDGNTVDGDCCNAICTVVGVDGTACSDGSACTASDTCQSGVCTGTDLCDDGNTCTVDRCANKSTGTCRHKPVSDTSNTQCPDDGSACTFDVCRAGACTHPNKCDDGNMCDGSENCTVDDTAPGGYQCSAGTNLPNGTVCDDANACTLNTTCQNGACQGGAAKCDDRLPCQTGLCINTNTGACRYTKVDDASNIPCTADSDNCTIDVCRNGACAHPSKCEDGNDCTADNCDPGTGQCSNPAKSNGTSCDDNNACTVNTTCYLGNCQGGGAKCDDRLPCQTGICTDTTTGHCTYSKVDDSSNVPCTADSDNCTLDVCRNGACAHPARCSDGNDCTTDACDPTTGACSYPAKTNGTGCDDFNACTINTTCSNGVCQGGGAKCDDRLPCQTGTCTNTSTGACHYTKVADNTTCTSDADNCTNDLCINGACTHSFKCGDGNDCTTDTCDPTTGACSYPAKTNGTGCDDFSACTLNTTCLNGTCQGGTAKCDDRLPCQTGICTNPTTGHCSYTKVADNTACTSDSDNCTNDLCINGACTHAFKCGDGNDCTTDSCNPTTGACSYPAKTNGTSCDDFNACTLNTTCANGVCQGGTAKCDDRLPCQSGTCTSTTSGNCHYTKAPDYTVCPTDGDNCTNDVCVSGTCTHPFKCSDGNDCTVDTCDQTTGACINTNKTNGVYCDDYNACTLSTSCLNGVCQGGVAKCDDRLPCQTGTCTSTTTGHCNYNKVPDNTVCTSDGNNCTNDLCANGTCTHPYKCVDGNDCTFDNCNQATGVCSYPAKSNGTACDDLVPCTVNTTCLNAVCQGGSPKCDDRLPCQTGTCNASSGNCRYTNADGAACNDNDGCTVNDGCLNGRCQGAIKDCDEPNVCTSDVCISPAGTCVHSPTHQGGACPDDGNQCTNDVCDLGICEHYNKLNGVACDDVNSCTPQSVCVSGVCTGQGCNTGTSCGACGQSCQDNPCGCR